MKFKSFNASSKYHNKKITIDGHKFDSVKEANRYRDLKLLLRAGKISNLELQKVYELIPAQYEEVSTGEIYKRGDLKGAPRLKKICLEHAITYVADFVYVENGKTVVEDTKGVKTDKYIIKRKLMLWRYGIKIKEI